MSKYEKLSSYLISLTVEQITLTFFEIEKIIGFSLPKSAYTYPAWWSNQAGSEHSQSWAWQSIGWQTRQVNLSSQHVSFRHTRIEVSKNDPALDSEARTQNRLSIAEAKAGLSAYYSVPIENVEIIIRG
jgi:hypothetical protein